MSVNNKLYNQQKMESKVAKSNSTAKKHTYFTRSTVNNGKKSKPVNYIISSDSEEECENKKDDWNDDDYEEDDDDDDYEEEDDEED